MKERLVQLVLRLHARDRDPHWRTIPEVASWPDLLSLHGFKRRWDADAEELWQNIHWCFLRAINRFAAKASSGSSKDLFYETMNVLRNEYRRKWRRINREAPLNAGLLENVGADDKAISSTQAQQRALKWLELCRDRGLIKDNEYLLLVSTRIYSKSLVDFAQEQGVSYQTAAKRRKRAEDKLRRLKK